jgi:hypothetical protein
MRVNTWAKALPTARVRRAVVYGVCAVYTIYVCTIYV